MNFADLLHELGLDLLALIWPTECVGCGRADRDCCAECLKYLRSLQVARRGELLLGIEAPVFACGAYEGVLRAVLLGYKHGGRVRFARHLAPLLRSALALAQPRRGGRPPLLVTAPSRPARVRERGFRHLEVLSRAALRGVPGSRPRVLRALRTLRGRTSQVGLRPAQREENAARIRVRRSSRALLRGREIVLLDDVITTGATVRAAQRALEDAGACVIAIVALCVVARRDTRQISGTGNGLLEESRLPERRKVAPHRPTA